MIPLSLQLTKIHGAILMIPTGPFAVVKHLRGSDEFKGMTKRMQNSKEMRADSMKKFFETNALYKNHVFYNSSTKQKTLQGFRLKVDEDDVRGFKKHMICSRDTV